MNDKARMWRGALLVVAAFLMSGNAPKQDAKKASQQQAQPAQQPAPPKEKPSASSGQERGCPGTRFPHSSCEAITAEATLWQIDVAREQARIAYWNNWLSLFTAFVAGAAAFFAAKAALAARETVSVLTAVERADVVVTLENYADSNVFVRFDIVANNLGRSTALITKFAFDWSASKNVEELWGFFADVKHRILPADSRVSLKTGVVADIPDLKAKPFLWVLVRTQAPIDGFIGKRFCFEVFEKPMTSHKVTHQLVFADEFTDGD